MCSPQTTKPQKTEIELFISRKLVDDFQSQKSQQQQKFGERKNLGTPEKDARNCL